MIRAPLVAVTLVALLNTPLSAGEPASDKTPPTLVSLSIKPEKLIVRGKDRTIEVEAVVTDAESGIDDHSPTKWWACEVCFKSPSGSQNVSRAFLAQHRVSGTKYRGKYRDDLVIPSGAEKGVWILDHVTMHDRVANRISLKTADVEALRLPTKFIIE